MSESEISELLAYVAVFFFLICGLVIFFFSKITVNYLEREMEKLGIESPVWDKGIGITGIMYAIVIVRNKPSVTSLLDDNVVLRFTRKKDRRLAVLFLVTFFISLTLAIIWSVLYGPDW